MHDLTFGGVQHRVSTYGTFFYPKDAVPATSSLKGKLTDAAAAASTVATKIITGMIGGPLLTNIADQTTKKHLK